MLPPARAPIELRGEILLADRDSRAPIRLTDTEAYTGNAAIVGCASPQCDTVLQSDPGRGEQDVHIRPRSIDDNSGHHLVRQGAVRSIIDHKRDNMLARRQTDDRAYARRRPQGPSPTVRQPAPL